MGNPRRHKAHEAGRVRQLHAASDGDVLDGQVLRRGHELLLAHDRHLAARAGAVPEQRGHRMRCLDRLGTHRRIGLLLRPEFDVSAVVQIQGLLDPCELGEHVREAAVQGLLRLGDELVHLLEIDLHRVLLQVALHRGVHRRGQLGLHVSRLLLHLHHFLHGRARDAVGGLLEVGDLEEPRLQLPHLLRKVCAQLLAYLAGEALEAVKACDHLLLQALGLVEAAGR
mmetsp:Transcript_76956/g.222490  ORF Transcript_76956/g.222490 Transcript_76956/m.222490 type:complete len:226 (-) Transcript_76956:97-774(-)